MALIDNCVAYWNMNETSGTRDNATGTAALDLVDKNTVSYGTGKIDNAADLERDNNEYFSITNANAGTYFEGLSEMSIFLWVKFESVATATREPFYTSWASNSGTLFYKDDSDILSFIIGNGTPTFDSVSWAPSSSVWYHVGVTYNAGAIKFYLDGTQLGADQSSTITTIPTTGNDVNIGKRTDSAAYLDGLIDEMGIWQRALSAAEVTELYNGGAGLTYPFTAAANTTNFFYMT